MSATSEELAAQAEQLQNSISFFHIAATAQAAQPPRDVAALRRPAAPVMLSRSAEVPTRPAIARDGRDRVKSSGVSLNLTAGGADGHDAEFERVGG
jgi:methyl-accepting chemotaxis protein